jgi:hypothetical protein
MQIGIDEQKRKPVFSSQTFIHFSPIQYAFLFEAMKSLIFVIVISRSQIVFTHDCIVQSMWPFVLFVAGWYHDGSETGHALFDVTNAGATLATMFKKGPGWPRRS